MATDRNDYLASAFLKLSQTWLDEQIARKEMDLASKESKLRDFGMEITRNWRDIVLLRRELKGLRQFHDNLSQEYGLEFDRICNISGVKSIDVGTGFIAVDTNKIIISYGDKRFRIGDFHVEIYLNGYVHISNMNNYGRYTFYEHPHVRDGKPCLGNQAEALSKLIAEGQLSTVVAILLSFLQSYNPEDAYCEITFWPEIPSNE